MSTSTEGRGTRPRKRIWVQHVAVETDKITMRVEAARARGTLTESQEIVAEGVLDFANKARLAAFRDDPIPSRFANWWRGALVETAYRRMHTARAQMVDLYDDDELVAEVPLVVARANSTMHRDDPRRLTVTELLADTSAIRRARMRRLVGDSYEQLDLEHAQLRSFRNILLSAATFLTVVTIGTLVFVAINPDLMPLCFTGEIHACPTTEWVGKPIPRSADILVVAVLGALGGALAATLSIRNLKGTSTPYDVPVALAALKVPMGALTAILGLVAIQGQFIPGLSQLDSQGMILAYALVFGFAQQALSRLLDQQAQNLLEGLPGGKDVEPAPNTKEGLTQPTAWASTATSVSAEQVPAVVPGAPGAPAEAASGGGAEDGDDDEGTGVVPVVSAAGDRPVEEPPSATQQDQFDLLEDTVNDRKDMTEDEEAELLHAEFGAPDEAGIYGAPPASDEAPGEGGTEPPPGPTPGGA